MLLIYRLCFCREGYAANKDAKVCEILPVKQRAIGQML
jgi:hypothetical protein